MITPTGPYPSGIHPCASAAPPDVADRLRGLCDAMGANVGRLEEVLRARRRRRCPDPRADRQKRGISSYISMGRVPIEVPLGGEVVCVSYPDAIPQRDTAMSWINKFRPTAPAPPVRSRDEKVLSTDRSRREIDRRDEKMAEGVATFGAKIIPDEIKRRQISMIVRYVLSVRARSP